MGAVTLPPDFIREFQALQEKVTRLEQRPTNPVPSYTTALRPAAASVPYLIIRNATTATFQGSTGAAWVDL